MSVVIVQIPAEMARVFQTIGTACAMHLVMLSGRLIVDGGAAAFALREVFGFAFRGSRRPNFTAILPMVL